MQVDRSSEGRLASTFFWLLLAGIAAAPFIALSTLLYGFALIAFLLLRPPVPLTPALGFLGLFAVVSLASIPAAAQPARAADHFGEVANLALFPLFLAGLALRPVKQILPRIFLGLTAVLVLWGLVEFALKVPADPSWRIRGPMSHYMTYSGLLVVLFGLLTAYALLGDERRLRLLSLGGALLAVVPVLLNLTRNAWVGLLAAVVLLAAARKRTLYLAAAAAAVLLLVLIPNPAGRRFLSIFDPADPTNRDRVAMWKAGWVMALEKPATGQGLGAVQDDYRRFLQPGAVRAEVPHLHSNPVHLLAERGFAALAAYLGFVGAVLWAGWRRRDDWTGLASLLACGGIFAAGLFEYNFGDTEVLWLTLAAAALGGIDGDGL
jgi:O-antigen ligase